MGQVIILGSSSALPDMTQDNTHMLIKAGERVILIDTATNPLPRLSHLGIGHDDLTDIIMTHFHPDHVSGLPQLLMGLWLLGRRRSLDIYGFKHSVTRMKSMLELYELQSWPDFFEVIFHEIPEQENVGVLDDENVVITGTPVKHLIPTLGIKVNFIKENRTFAYSCDTEPCQQMINLARQVDVLMHEATGEGVGHTSPAQAGAIAQKAGAKTLFLIHYSDTHQNTKEILEEAHSTFSGNVHLARDLMTLEF